MKRLFIIVPLLLLAACSGLDSNPYSGKLHKMEVNAIYPESFSSYLRSGVKVKAEEVNLGHSYIKETDEMGAASFHIPSGVYRVSISDISGDDVFNGAIDKVKLLSDISIMDTLTHSVAGRLVFKEIYCGGCMKTPEQGTYQSDQYVIIHNNYHSVQYLDALCFGTLAPYNSNSSNPFLTTDPVTGAVELPSFLPVIQAVWQFPGNGTDFPLESGADVVICLRGAIDHSASYPLSVNLNRSGFFVCYNATYFTNTAYHPAPGNNISADHYLDVVVKTGQANAYTFSINSPTAVLFRSPEGMTMKEYVSSSEAIVQIPGSIVDKVVKIDPEWVLDAVEVFNGSSSSNSKRLPSYLDAGYVTLSGTFLGHSLFRKTNEDISESVGYEVLCDTNNSSEDFYERESQSLHE